MVLHRQRLPFPLVPLIAEAKRRARRRRAAAVLAVTLAAGFAVFALRSPQPGGSPPGPTGGVSAQSGHGAEGRADQLIAEAARQRRLAQELHAHLRVEATLLLRAQQAREREAAAIARSGNG